MKPEQMIAEADRLLQLGQLEAAAATLTRVLQIRPSWIEALPRLALVQASLGQNAAAVANYEAAARLAPNDFRILNNLGALLLKMDRPEEAIGWYRKGLAAAPNDIGVLDNLGTALRKVDRHAEAVASHEAALRLAPNSARTHNHLGVALMEMNRTDEAIASFRRSLALAPNSYGTHNNLALAFKNAGCREESLACFRDAAALAPEDVWTRNNLGVALMEMRQFDEALAQFQLAVGLDVENVVSHVSHFHLAILRLVTGDFDAGWKEYEWRPRRIDVTIPTWDGSPLAGRTILLRSEQGFGDAIHFVRYAALVKARGGVVILETRSDLAELLATCPGVDRVVLVGTAIPSVDVQADLASLPGIFGTNLANIPAPIPYLYPDADRVESWRQRLGPRTGLRVGIAWQGSRTHTNDRQRSVDPSRFAPLAATPGVQLFSLQKGSDARPTCALIDRTAELDSFLDTAALIKNLDLVIAVDTAVAHLAGALGVPVWVSLPYAPDWRWLLDRPDSPWYPTMWLVRQSALDRWDDVFARMSRELESHVSAEYAEPK
jgi:Tfp pilus assembly protein PilF